MKFFQMIATTACSSDMHCASNPALVNGGEGERRDCMQGVCPVKLVNGGEQRAYSGLCGVPSGLVNGGEEERRDCMQGVPSGLASIECGEAVQEDESMVAEGWVSLPKSSAHGDEGADVEGWVSVARPLSNCMREEAAVKSAEDEWSCVGLINGDFDE